jgi:hypothetical protein
MSWGIHLIGMHLIGVHLTGIYLVSVYLIGVISFTSLPCAQDTVGEGPLHRR